MLFFTALSRTYSTMVIQVKSKERIFKHVTLSFPSSLHVYENKSSQSYRVIFNSKNFSISNQWTTIFAFWSNLVNQNFKVNQRCDGLSRSDIEMAKTFSHPLIKYINTDL